MTRRCIQQKKRDANLDLLRIISMLLIIFLHSIDHSGVLETAEQSSAWMYAYVQYGYALTQVCVNCYVMLSGYYLVKSKFRLQKLVALWMETAFYAFVIKAIFMALGRTPFSLFSLVSCFFPILTGRYWFITIYVGMYILSPFLNKLVFSMNRQQFTWLNIVLFFVMSVWVSIHPALAGMNSGAGWGLAWFVTLYLAAAWFRLYARPSGKKWEKIAAFFAIPAVMAAGLVLTRQGGGLAGIARAVFDNWYRYDSAPVYLATLCLFSALLNTRIENERVSGWITKIAPLTFGVYLIHAHADFSPWSWEVLQLPRYMDSLLFPAIQLGAVFAIFVFCAAVDWVRMQTVGRMEKSAALNRACERITESANRGIAKYLG